MDVRLLLALWSVEASEWAVAGAVFLVGLVVAFVCWQTVLWLFARPTVRDQAWSRALRRPVAGLVFWGLALKTLGLAAGEISYLKQNPGYVGLLDRALGLAWLAFVCVMAVRFILALFRASKDPSVDPTAAHRTNLVRKLLLGVVSVFAVLFGLRLIGIDTTPLLAGGAVGGLIVGLALQESLSNVFSGILFSMDESVRVGDLVRISDTKEGYVQRIGWRTTLVKLWDDSLLVVPNSQMSKEKIVNLSYPVLPFVVNIEFSVAYSSDLESVEEVCVQVAKDVQSSLADSDSVREPFVRWQGFREGSIGVKVFMPVPSPDVQYRAKSDLVKALHRAMGKHGIVVPFPTVSLSTPSEQA